MPGLVTDLPYSNNGVSDKDKKDDEGFHEGRDGLFTFLKPGQHLRSEHKEEISLGVGTQVETTVKLGQTAPEKHANMSKSVYNVL